MLQFTTKNKLIIMGFFGVLIAIFLSSVQVCEATSQELSADSRWEVGNSISDSFGYSQLFALQDAEASDTVLSRGRRSVSRRRMSAYCCRFCRRWSCTGLRRGSIHWYFCIHCKNRVCTNANPFTWRC